MSNSITLNIVEPGSPTPDPVVPNTGLFTGGIGGPEATVIGTVLILTIAAIVVAFLYRKQKKSGKVTKLVHVVDSTKAVITNKKRITAGLTALALLASAGTFAALLSSTNKNNTSAAEGEDAITPVVSDDELTIELGDEPVFAYLPVDITVEQATEAGYTLTAFADSTDLVSTTDESKTIPMIAVDEGELATLADNAYGLALTKPASQEEEIFTALSTDADTPTILAEKEEATEADDKTTIYYGFYITPDTPYGVYTSGEINYNMEKNGATVIYDGNGLSFNDDASQITNKTSYIITTSDKTEKKSHTPNMDDNGIVSSPVGYRGGDILNQVINVPGAASLKIELTYGGGILYGSYEAGFASFWQGAHPDYTTGSNLDTAVKTCGTSDVTDGKFAGGDTNVTTECSVSGDSVTFAYWTQGGGPSNGATYGYYAVITGYDADGNIFYLPENQIISGDYLTPSSTTAYRFLGWDENSEATNPAYPNEEAIENNLPLTLGETTTLYAIWESAFTITYDGNGANSTPNMDMIQQYTADLEAESKQVDLLVPNFKREGYGFIGWSEDKEAYNKLQNGENPIIYGPNQTITITDFSKNMKLYAVWVPVEADVTMQTFDPTSSIYASKSNGSVIALKDGRDNEVYAVAKLADGNWWMTENLRLDSEPELSQQNTNNPSLPLTNDTESTTSNFLSATSNNWCTTGEPECVNQSKLNTSNTTLTANSPSFSQDFTSDRHSWNTGSLNANIASYGNYYNWYSAAAGNGTYSTGEQGAETVAGDICPAGWILPIGDKTDAKGSFSHLDTSMGGTGEWQGSIEASNRWRSFPNNFVYSGYWSGSSADDRGYYGGYWSSTAGSTFYAYGLYFYSDGVGPGTDGGNKFYGDSVRCVAPVE